MTGAACIFKRQARCEKYFLLRPALGGQDRRLPLRGRVCPSGIHFREVQYPLVDERHFRSHEKFAHAITAGEAECKLPNLPPGKSTITAWHESHGEHIQEVTIAGNEATIMNFVSKA